MNVISKIGREDLATVYVGEIGGLKVEFVESVEPPLPRDEKWVVIVSTLFGCPVECEMCDAGGSYKGRPAADDILAQIDHVVRLRYPNGVVPAKKFKIHFARVGEPSLNPAVLDVLKRLPGLYDAPGMFPSISTVAPSGSDGFFDKLIDVRDRFYRGKFQLQFSVHSTDEAQRDRIIPVPKWSLEKIADYGRRFFGAGERKITLNFILAGGYIIDPHKLRAIFPPEIFFVKLTPLNPTRKGSDRGLICAAADGCLNGVSEPAIAGELRAAGFDVLWSVGDLGENLIGSNCGQYLGHSCPHL